jgi:ketol-acid reductoisomerase
MRKPKAYAGPDADARFLDGKTIAVLGYGSQGSAQAKCMRDSGLSVTVGAREGSRSGKIAEEDRFEVLSLSEAAEKADVICMLVPDLAQKEVYERHVAPSLSPGKTLYFSHGFSVAFGLVSPPECADVVMLAPKATGARLRESYLNGGWVPSFVSVHQDASGNALKTVLAIAKALNLTSRGVFECTFAQEASANLFGEQAVTIGGAMRLVEEGFETLVGRGIPPELAYYECVRVTNLILGMLESEGLKKTVHGVSETAGYGGLSRGPRVVNESVRARMEEIYSEIESGQFAREWLAERARGGKAFEALKKKEGARPIGEAFEALKRLGESR